jgi:hypothetical protein
MSQTRGLSEQMAHSGQVPMVPDDAEHDMNSRLDMYSDYVAYGQQVKRDLDTPYLKKEAAPSMLNAFYITGMVLSGLSVFVASGNLYLKSRCESYDNFGKGWRTTFEVFSYILILLAVAFFAFCAYALFVRMGTSDNHRMMQKVKAWK